MRESLYHSCCGGLKRETKAAWGRKDIIRRKGMFRKVSSRLLWHMKTIMVCNDTVLFQIEADQ